MDIVELYEVEKGYVRIIFIFVWMKMGVFKVFFFDVNINSFKFLILVFDWVCCF